VPTVGAGAMNWFRQESLTAGFQDFAFTGTDAVGANVVRALGDRAGVILASHGNVCVGKSLERAMNVALTMESCARVYLEALKFGEPVSLPPEAIRAGRRLFDEKKRP